MSATSTGQADWSRMQGYEYGELVDVFLLVAEVVGKRVAERQDRKTFSQMHGWLEQILGQCHNCIEDGSEYQFLIKRADDDDTQS